MKLHHTLLLSTLLGASLHANTLFENEKIDQEFEKFQTLFNTMLNHAKAYNMNDAKSSLGFTGTQVNIYEENNNYIIKYQLAGIDKEDIQLSLDDNRVLNLKVEKQEEKEDKSKQYHTKQISFNYINQSVQLPDNIDIDKMDSVYKNGILTVSMPILKPVQPKAKIINIR